MEEMVRVLAVKGAEVDAEDGEGRTALTVALAFGQEAAARALLEAGAGVNAGAGQRPLHAAAEKGMVEMLSNRAQKVELVGSARVMTLHEGEDCTLIAVGADVNAGKGQRALHLAAKNGLHEAVRQLLEAGAELGRADDDEDGEGRTALTVALAFRQKAAAGALLEVGAGVNAGTGQRPLHAAAMKGMEEMVRELVEKSTEVDAEDGERRTALTVALAFGQEAAARALLEAGAGVNAGTGRRPLHMAAERGLVEMVRELVGKVVGKKLALFERGKLKAGDVLHFVLRGAVLEVALNDSPFEEAFTELPADVVPFVQLAD
ncbi:hypothetical protein CYMTET_32958 [Cymbomonas tetramitiformis]|uniref:Uncharacterized protein n=1 Tax=Cymbomonas tetramitiformis TaxID=36881 RepID=A0AAE0KRP7_9CHLO|nr:hypothetical protein CYMTET_32958 [Cymbomonas tetramitiformis]